MDSSENCLTYLYGTCQEIKKLNSLINAYLEELDDYAKTVQRLNKEIKEMRDR